MINGFYELYRSQKALVAMRTELEDQQYWGCAGACWAWWACSACWVSTLRKACLLGTVRTSIAPSFLICTSMIWANAPTRPLPSAKKNHHDAHERREKVQSFHAFHMVASVRARS